jgi:hypothetical protein
MLRLQGANNGKHYSKFDIDVEFAGKIHKWTVTEGELVWEHFNKRLFTDDDTIIGLTIKKKLLPPKAVFDKEIHANETFLVGLLDRPPYLICEGDDIFTYAIKSQIENQDEVKRYFFDMIQEKIDNQQTEANNLEEQTIYKGDADDPPVRRYKKSGGF